MVDLKRIETNVKPTYLNERDLIVNFVYLLTLDL